MTARALLCTSLLWLGGALPATAQEPEFIEDSGHIVILEHDGENYDRDTEAGDLNAAPRQRIARKLIETHGDFYDFIVVFTNFDFDRGSAVGFYTNVRNDVEGINLPVVDNGDGFGSPARLQGFIDMGPIDQYRMAPLSLESGDPDFRTTLGVLAHEIGHRWLASVRFDSGGGPRGDLIGSDDAHWSFLLSSDASFLYGNTWEPLGGERYRSVETQSRFGELDLYLMGLLSPEDVAPLTLLVNPDVDPARLPELGAEIEVHDVETVTVEQIVAAEGPRVPGHDVSQKDFAIAFVFLTAESLLPTARDLEGVELIRTNFTDTFFALTRGQALADPDLQTVAPISAGAIPDTALSLTWLLSQQQLDGRYESHPLTRLRDTSSVVVALSILGVRGSSVDDARDWLTLQDPASVDYLARALTAGANLSRERLVSLRNPDGGFGIASGYLSDALDTALALKALLDTEPTPELTVDVAGALVAMQLPDGGFSSIAGQPADVMTTSEAALALALSGSHPLAVQNALAWLVERQQPDGGFGDGASLPYATARALEALLNGSSPPSAIDGAIDFLQQTQRADGSWSGSVFDTASVLQALVPSTVANLAIEPSDVHLDPNPPEVGELVNVEVTVRNRARVAAGSFDVQLFDGDPELGGIGIGAPQIVSSLAPSETRVLTFSWDTTGFEGPHTLYAVADFAGAVSEVSKEDNVAIRDVDVLPLLPNLRITAASATPPSPIEGASTTLTARVDNSGSAPSGTTHVRFYRENPRLGIELGSVAVPALASADSVELSVNWDTTGQLGAHTVYAVVDPDDADVVERFESDNEASFAIDIRQPPPAQPDLEIAVFALTPSELAELPQDVRASARIVNTGLDPVPSVSVELFQGHPDIGGVPTASTVIALGGDTSVDVALDFSVATGGTRTYYLRVDAGAVVERDDTNNLASADLRDLMDVVDVTLEPGSIVLSASSIDAGELLEVDVRVRNSGTRTLSSVAVALFYELSPDSLRLASSSSVALAPGASEIVRLSWTANRSGTVPLELRVDPNDVLSETNEDDNVLTTSVDVTASSLANLSVSASDIGSMPVELVEGAPAVIQATIRNLGDVAAGAFTVSFYVGDPAQNGLLIDTVALAGIDAGSEAAAVANWDPLNQRGATLVYVDVDSDGRIDEIDELDNQVFRIFDIEGLSELVATTAQLRLSPPFARSGETVLIEASFTNAGAQAAAPMAVEIRLDDPVAGVLLASREVNALAAGASGSFSTEWDTTGVEGEHELYLVLDVRNDVVEQREDNNVARVAVALQSADVFVAPVFFSPNGDGIRDEAVLSYRLSVGSDIRVEVRDVEERFIRELVTTSEDNARVVWDGRDDNGVLAVDGAYFLVVLADGAEVLRRRVVLDTNRSRIIEALGTDLVSLTELTCPLPGALAGPAWLPDDAAAYVIVTHADPIDAPDYPMGLYRVSSDGRALDLVVADDTTDGLSFVDQHLYSNSRMLRPVSADGQRALVKSSAEGLQILDLTSGGRTPLGHDAEASAVWTSDGRRVLVSSTAGLFFYDARGSFVDTLDSSDIQVAVLSPDDTRVVYRRRGEIFLRVIDSGGNNARVLEATRTTNLFGAEVELDAVDIEELLFLDNDTVEFVWFFQSAEESPGSFRLAITDDTANESTFIGVPSFDRRWEIRGQSSLFVARRIDGRQTRPVIPSVGAHSPSWSYRDTHITYTSARSEGCVGGGLWVVRSLLNGEVDFRLTRLPSSFGVQITGTVSDQNLDTYTLDYASVENPEAFAPIQPASDVPVVADTITTWIPPAPGDYLVRLTLRDQAGNETVRLDRIFWDETPPIASLRRSPTYISPNGDGGQDELLVEYDVLAPANLVFHIRDADGRSVRSIERNESTLGPASFVWDGTDDFDVTVDDGDYVLEIQGALFPVIVDNTAPDVAAAYSALYTYFDNNTSARLAVDLEGHILDSRLESWALVDVDGEIVADSQRVVGTESEDAVMLERLTPIQGLELRARDRSGNTTVVPLAGPNREVRVVLAGAKNIGAFQPGPPQPVGAEFVEPSSGISFAAQASFEGVLRFLYRAEGDTDPIEIETTKFASFRGEDLVLGQTYRGHFEADGAASQEVEFTVGPSAIFLAGQPTLVGANIFVTNTVTEAIVEARLLRNGTDVVRVYRPLTRSDVVSVANPACGESDSYLVEATGASGAVYRSTVRESYPLPAALSVSGAACLSVDDVGVERQASVDAPASGQARALVRNQLAPASPESLVLLLTDGVTPPTEVGRAVGISGNTAIPFDVELLSEGSYRLAAQAILTGGETIEGDYAVRFFLDQSAPEVSIISPAEGGVACIANVDGRDVMNLDVLVRDRELAALNVEILLPNGTWEPLGSVDPPLFPVFGELLQTLPVIVPEGLSGETTIRLVARNARITSEDPERPASEPPRWPNPLNNGGLSSSVVRTLVVSPTLGLGPLTTVPSRPALFSPNTDGVDDDIRVVSEALEDVSLTVRVLTTGATPVLVRTLASELPVSAGAFEIVWDGRDNDGSFVVDGDYDIEVEAVNGCGGASTDSIRVEVDNTPPTVSLDNLVDDQPVAIAVEVRGVATDEHFDHYVLELGEGPAPLTFTNVIPPVERRVPTSAILGNWSLGELVPGTYTLRLSATDAVGNRASTDVRVEVLVADFLAGYEATPTIFSPNGDAVQDESELRFELKADARVTLSISSSSDILVATLIEGEVLLEGPHIAVWDGLGLDDGDYTALLRAEDPVVETLFEESRIGLSIDTVAPQLALDAPVADGFIALPSNVSGSITDDHLERYNLELGPAIGVATPLAEDSVSVTGTIAPLPRLNDGQYRLRVFANDTAGNRSELELTFDVDSTRPAVALTAPTDGSFITRVPATVAVVGSIEETNLERYDIELALGDPASSFVTLAGGAVLPSESELASWELDALPDGLYTIRLKANDRAANFALVDTTVTLDTTPPSVVIDTPQADAFVSDALTVRGSLTDANFRNGTVFVAPAERPEQLTEIASFEESVATSELVTALALADGNYLLELRAEDLAGNTSSTTTPFAVDTVEPEPASDLMADVDSTDVALRWSASPSSDVVGYHVERDGARMTSTPVSETSYLDPGLEEGAYRYTVIAVDGAGLESAPSEPATASIDLTPPLSILRSPGDAERVRVEVDVIGTAFAENDFLEYRLSVAPIETPASPTLLKRSSVPVSFGTLALWQPLVDGDYILTLAAEDTNGNIGEDSTRVTVDNAPPGAPVLLRADVLPDADLPDDIELEWSAPSGTDTDIAGFLVFRNGKVANASGTVSGSLRPFLVDGPTYVDADLPDGEHCYRIVTMDLAGNLSIDSNELCELLDNRPPAALIFDPDNGAQFDTSRTIRADSEDLDIATVAFEFQLASDVVWTPIATDSDGAPYEIFWDITGLVFDDYRLRAVATDIGSRPDPAPATIDVVLGDVTAPPVPTELLARTVGDRVELSWTAVVAADLAGYRIFRDDTLVLEPGAGETATSDAGVSDDAYSYTIRAVDADDNESDASDVASVRVYAPTLLPDFPVIESATVELAGAGAEPGATVRLFAAGGLDELATTSADALGAFVFSSFPLALGPQAVEAEATDTDGNISRRSMDVLLIQNDVPAQPTGFSAVANGDGADLSWSANGEADLSGYLATRDGEIVNVRGLLRPTGEIPTAHVARASNAADPNLALGPGRWILNVNTEGAGEGWIEIELDEPRHLEEIRMLWSFQRSAKDYDLLVELEGRLVPVVRVRDQAAAFGSIHPLPTPLQTTRVRLHIYSSATVFSVFLDELELHGVLPETTTTFSDTPTTPGLYDYGVQALDTLGGRSLAAGPINIGVGDLTPPEPPTALVATVDAIDVLLTWSASASPDVSLYRVFRDGEPIRDTASTLFTDQDLVNATYAYHVVAIDHVGNVSAASNVELAVVDVEPPSAPVLSVMAVPAGGALSLAWTESVGPLGISSYVLSRALVAGGPYNDVASVNGSTFAFTDTDLDDGVGYFYVVKGVDFRGEPSSPSNEVSATPDDMSPPPAPFWALPLSPQVVSASRTTLVGGSEPSTTVEASRDGLSLGTTTAADDFVPVASSFIRTNANVAGRFAMSPERRVVAEVGTNSSFSEPEVHLYDLSTGDVRVVPYEEDRSFERDVAFSPDGRRIAVSTTLGQIARFAIRILDIDAETTEVLELAEASNTLAWIAQDRIAVVVGADEIQVFDLTADTQTTIYTRLSFFEPDGLIASPDGAYLAWRESDSLYVMPSDGVTPPQLVHSGVSFDNYAWVGDQVLAYAGFAGGVQFYDVNTATSTAIAGTEGFHTLRALPATRGVSAFDGFTLMWVLTDGAVVELGEPPDNYNAFLEWSDQLALAGVTFGFTLSVTEPPGRFELDARLVSGLNVITAIASDAAGNASADSSALELTYATATLADLTLDGEITVIPSAPTTGDTASISVSVLNRGEADAEATLLSVSGADFDGTVYAIGTTAVPTLPSGASTSVSVSWDTASRLGPQSIAATVDPLQLIDEADEDNNTQTSEATVVGTAGLELAIVTGRASYGPAQLAELTISGVNGGGARDIALETVIEDTSGARVASVDARGISLAYAGSTHYQVFWSVGSTTAGSYIARVNALSGVDVVGTATAAFELTRSVTVALDLVADRASYEQGDRVTLLTRVVNVESNTPLRDLSLRYRIMDPSSTAVFDLTKPMGYLALGGSASSQAVWLSGAAEPGAYTVSVEAFEGAELIASTSGGFKMTAATSPTLSGALTLPADAVPTESDMVARYDIDNLSVVALTAGTVRVELFDPTSAIPVASAEGALSLGGSESTVGELRIDTNGLELGGYIVVLSAGDGSLDALASAPLTLFQTPAAPSLNAPAAGANAAQRLLLSVNNATNPNGEALSYEFELYLDAGLTISIGSASGLPEGPATTAWTVLQFLEENRGYYWRARAKDRFATSDWMTPAEVFVNSGNERPDAPTLSAPAESSEVETLRPELVVGNANDPEGDALTYTFELYRDAGLIDLALTVSDIVETLGTTPFTPAEDLDEDATYYWRARAHDGELDGDWMPTASFRVNTANQAPDAPTPVEPVGGVVTTLSPELVVAPGIDPEGDLTTHTFQIDVTDSFDSPARQDSPTADELRWAPPIALVENTVYFWRARAADALASGPWSNTVSFLVDTVNEPPDAPTPQRPGDDSVVESATPVLAVVNATDPERDPLTYTFEVYSDAALSDRVAGVTTLPEGETETAWAVTPRLEEETTYYWLAYASDASNDGERSATQSFRVNVMNEEPSAPSLVSPLEGAIVAAVGPTLAIANGSDPDGDPLTYLFEVYDDELLASPPIESSGEISESIDETSWMMSAPLNENAVYYWRARAFDGRLESAWMATARFRFSLDNEPPTTPSPVAPGDGDVVADTRPTLVITASTDPEGDVVRHTYEVFRDAGLTELVVASPETEETSWRVDVELDENATFYWHALASDGDLQSAPSESLSFFVNVVNEPPNVPSLLTPVDGAIVEAIEPTLTFANATSPDGALGEPLVYHVALYADAGLSDILAEDVAVPEGASGQTSWEPPVTLTPGTFYWRARSVDARGLLSDWAAAFSFSVAPPSDDCPPGWHDDFERYPKHVSPEGWRLETESKRPSFEVKKVAGSKQLVSSKKGRGSLLFAGNGEAFDWRNYEFEGELRSVSNGSDDDSSDDDSSDDDSSDGKNSNKRCSFATGVAFYADPTAGSAYRLEIIGPECKDPKARIVKVQPGGTTELTRVDLTRNYKPHSLRFHIEAINNPNSTSLQVRLNAEVGNHDKQWTLAFEDTDAPLRSGTIGAWSDFVRADWDNFHVREIQGFSSGISGDADGDGVCDVGVPGTARSNDGRVRRNALLRLATSAATRLNPLRPKVYVQHFRPEPLRR